MNTWENSSPRGQIRAVIRTICDSELFRTHGANAQKIKTPLEYAVSAIRALRSTTADGFYTADTDGYSLVTPLVRMGTMALFDRGDPDGFPETAPGWVSAGTLAERLRFVQTIVMPTGDSTRNDSIAGGNKSFIDPSALLRRKLAAGLWSDAAAVSQYFVSTLYPGEGAGNLERYRTIAKNFLDTADDGVTASPFRLLTPGSAAHDQRLRGVVAMLMTLQRFQEQ